MGPTRYRFWTFLKSQKNVSTCFSPTPLSKKGRDAAEAAASCNQWKVLWAVGFHKPRLHKVASLRVVGSPDSAQQHQTMVCSRICKCKYGSAKSGKKNWTQDIHRIIVVTIYSSKGLKKRWEQSGNPRVLSRPSALVTSPLVHRPEDGLPCSGVPQAVKVQWQLLQWWATSIVVQHIPQKLRQATPRPYSSKRLQCPEHCGAGSCVQRHCRRHRGTNFTPQNWYK